MVAGRAQAGDIVQLISPKGKSSSFRLEAGKRLETMHGILQHDDLIGAPYGSQVESHLGKPFTLLQPALDDMLRDLRRSTQVIYPKDVGYILVSMGIGPGQQVLEAGSGSGALTIALAHAVGPEGHIYSYEHRPETSTLARNNLAQFGLEERVTLKVRDIAEGFDESGLRAVYLDLPNPEAYLSQAAAALSPGGFFGCILPTTNQVSLLLDAIKHAPFGFVEVSEILHRYYKPVANRLRPADTMNAHTGFLIFARRLFEESLDATP